MQKHNKNTQNIMIFYIWTGSYLMQIIAFATNNKLNVT